MAHVDHSPALLAADSELERLLRGEPAPAVLLPYQQYWITETARVRIFEKSRRIGITWATAADCVLEAASGKQDIWYVNYSEDGAKEFIRDCSEWCERLGVAAASLVVEVNNENDDTPLAPAAQSLLDWTEEGAKGVRALQIRFPSGKRITALTSNPRNLRGKQGRVIIDEAAYHNDLPSLLKAAFALMMWGGEVWVLSTHNGAENAFATLCDEVRDGKKPYALHRCTITEALAQGLYQRICTSIFAKSGKIMDTSPAGEAQWLAELELEYGDGADEELYCKPVGSGESYIGRPLVEQCMFDAPVVRFEQSNDWCALREEERAEETREWCDAVLRPLIDALKSDNGNRSHTVYPGGVFVPCKAFGLGMDFARSLDLSVIAPIGVTQQLKRRVPFLVEMRNVPHMQQWQVLNYIMTALPNLMYSIIDAGGNGSFVAEQAWLAHGGDDHVLRVQLSIGYYRENMASFKEAHEERLIEYPRDADVRRDMAQIKRINGVPKVSDERTANDGKKGGRRHGDAAIALFLANNAARMAEELWVRWEGLTSI